MRGTTARGLAALGAVCTLLACGPEGALWLRIEAPLRVPDQADAVQVTVRQGGPDGRSLFSRTDALEPLQFPVTLTLETWNRGNLEPADLWVTTTALLRGAAAAPWANASGQVSLPRRQLAELTLQLCDCGK